MPLLKAKFPNLDMSLPLTVKGKSHGQVQHQRIRVLSSFHVKGGCEYLLNNNIIYHIQKNYYLSVPPHICIKAYIQFSSKEKKRVNRWGSLRESFGASRKLRPLPQFLYLTSIRILNQFCFPALCSHYWISLGSLPCSHQKSSLWYFSVSFWCICSIFSLDIQTKFQMWVYPVSMDYNR